MKVVLSSQAASDLRRIARFIAQDHPTRATSSVEELRQTARHLGELPHGFPASDPARKSRPFAPTVGLSEPVPQFLIADLRSAMHFASMENATLIGFLNGDLSPEVLAAEIAAEVNACDAAFRAGKNGYILITDGSSFKVTREAARRLLAAVVEERMPFKHANYVADCIMMSDDFAFADDVVRDAVHFVEDDSRPPTHDEMIEALAKLG